MLRQQYFLKKSLFYDRIILTLGNITYPYIFLEVKLQKGGSEMEQKVVLVLGSVAAVGFAVAGVILAVRMPQDATPGAFAALANAAARGLAIAENSTC